MINIYKVKKWGAFITSGLLPVLFFVIGAQFYGFLAGVAAMVLGLLFGVLIGMFLVKNPFTDMLEGKGLLALDVNSTGVITPFIVNIVSNQVRFIDPKTKEEIDEPFDREAVHMLNVPKALKSSKVVVADNKFYMKLDQDEFNSGRFSLFQYPVLFYNSLLKTILTKEMLSDNEKTAFAEHSILHLNHQVRDLSRHIRDFGRAVVETLKPAKSLTAQWWFWLIIGVVVIMLIVLLAPLVSDAIANFGGNAAAQAINTANSAAGNSGAINPI